MPTLVQWIKHLEAKISEQVRYHAPMERRYANQHILPFLAKEYAEVYPGLVVAGADGRTIGSLNSYSLSTLDVPRTGTAAVVVDAFTERLTVEGLTSPDDTEAARLLAAAWEDNDLDVMHQEGHREALIGARAFASTAREENGDRAVVGIESMTQMAVHRMQAAPYDIDAALKIWTDEWTGERHGLLRLPGVDYPLVEGKAELKDPEGSGESSRWIVSEPTKTGVAEVPVVELAPRSRLLAEPTSEIDRIVTAVDILDLIEGLMVFAGHFGAVPIRYVSGLTVPRDPKDPSKPLLDANGKPLIGFNPRADHLWADTNKDAKFGQLEPAALTSFVDWSDHAAGVLRRQTRLPSAYFSLDLKSHMSGELLKTDEAPMVRRMRAMGQDGHLNAAWRRLGQHILAIEAPRMRARVRARWVNPETLIESAAVDQVTKLVSTGMGVATVAEKVLGWDPELIADAVAEAESREAALNPDFNLLFGDDLRDAAFSA